MRIVSFDVGIKNLAMCVFDCVDSGFQMIEWRIINLLQNTTDPATSAPTCQAVLSKTKTVETCNKKANFQKCGHYYCKTHANKAVNENRGSFQTATTTPAFIKKYKKDQLIECWNQVFPFQPQSIPSKKEDILDNILEYYKQQHFVPYKHPKQKNANDMTLVEISKCIQSELSLDSHLKTVTTVLIENQITPIAGRMGIIQGMLIQYFVGMNSGASIHCISSSNKLKGFTVNEENTYKHHKQDAKQIAVQLLETNAAMIPKQFITAFHAAIKKDDLADSFLQLLGFLKGKGFIAIQNNYLIMRIT